MEDLNPSAGLDGLDEQLVSQLVDRARAGGLQLTGKGGVLQQLTKRLLESALDGEITDHLGYERAGVAADHLHDHRQGELPSHDARCVTPAAIP